MYAPRPRSTTISAMVDFRPRILPPPPPRVDAAREDDAGNDEQREQLDVGLHGRRHGDAPIVGLFRPNRDQVLLLRQPADDVHEEIAVALDAEDAVRREIGIAE